jgi:6-phospho-beta-glucosidase
VKLAIIGGGGFRVPLVYRALLADTGRPRVDDVALYDTSAERLQVMSSVLAHQAEGVPDAPRIHTTTDLDEALGGAQFVFSAIRVGGVEARTQDERVALRLGVLGQETTGPGGLAYGLRTIPAAQRIAERVKELAPDAYIINFTNPAGMITEAMQRVVGDRVIGICDTPSGLGRRISAVLGVDPKRVQLDYVGLNHLGWMRRLIVDGHDRLPELLADDAALAGLEEGTIFGVPWLQSLGCVPNEYLYYYYFNRDAVRSIRSQEATRGEFLVRQQAEFYAAAADNPDKAFDLWHRTIAERRALYMAEAKGTRVEDVQPTEEPVSSGYEGVALGVMAAIARNERSTMILNVRNNGALPGLDADAVVELPSTVDANGAHPLATSPPDLHQLGLIQQVKMVERLTIEAATTGSPDAALKAFALHPLVDSVRVGRELLDGYVDAIPEVAQALGARP